MPILTREVFCFPEDILEVAPPETDRCWWAVYTKARQEKALARQLLSHEIPFYLPLIPKDNIIRGRRVRSHIPLFGGYVFLFGTHEERVMTLATNRTSRVLLVADQSRLRHDLFHVQILIDQNAPLAIERRLTTGDLVRIKCGALRGLEGMVIKRHGKMRLLVAVTYLQQGVSIEIDDCALEPM